MTLDLEHRSWQSYAKCGDLLPLVDAAFQNPFKHARELWDKACCECPVRDRCETVAMGGEFGVWAGTTPNNRTRRGAPGHQTRKSALSLIGTSADTR